MRTVQVLPALPALETGPEEPEATAALYSTQARCSCAVARSPGTTPQPAPMEFCPGGLGHSALEAPEARLVTEQAFSIPEDSASYCPPLAVISEVLEATAVMPTWAVRAGSAAVELGSIIPADSPSIPARSAKTDVDLGVRRELTFSRRDPSRELEEAEAG